MIIKCVNCNKTFKKGGNKTRGQKLKRSIQETEFEIKRNKTYLKKEREKRPLTQLPNEHINQFNIRVRKWNIHKKKNIQKFLDLIFRKNMENQKL